jgi:hypothetical protein
VLLLSSTKRFVKREKNRATPTLNRPTSAPPQATSLAPFGNNHNSDNSDNNNNKEKMSSSSNTAAQKGSASHQTAASLPPQPTPGPARSRAWSLINRTRRQHVDIGSGGAHFERDPIRYMRTVLSLGWSADDDMLMLPARHVPAAHTEVLVWPVASDDAASTSSSDSNSDYDDDDDDANSSDYDSDESDDDDGDSDRRGEGRGAQLAITAPAHHAR